MKTKRTKRKFRLPRKTPPDLRPRSANAGDEAPYYWKAKAAHYALKEANVDAATYSTYDAIVLLENNSRDIRPPGPEFYASSAQIAGHAGCGARTVERKIKLLAQLGLIVILSGRRSGKMHEANRYMLTSMRSIRLANQNRQDGESVPPSISSSMADNKDGPNKAHPSDGRPIPAPAATRPAVAGARRGASRPMSEETKEKIRSANVRRWKEKHAAMPTPTPASPPPPPPTPTPEQIAAEAAAAAERARRKKQDDEDVAYFAAQAERARLARKAARSP